MEAKVWIKDHLQFNPLTSVRFADLYSAYKAEQAQRGLVSVGSKQFARHLRAALKPLEDANQVAFANRSGLVIVGASYC